MLIKLWIEDVFSGEKLEELGTCLTDNATRAVSMYADREIPWIDKGYHTIIRWIDVTDEQ